MLLPGPEAQQLATDIGWLMHRTWGGVIAGVLTLIGLSWMYIAFGDVPVVAGLFYGIKPAVTAIVLQAAHRIGGRALKNNAITAAVVGVILNLACFFGYHVLWLNGFNGHLDWPSLLIAMAAAIALFRFKRGVIEVLIGCALMGLAVHLLH